MPPSPPPHPACRGRAAVFAIHTRPARAAEFNLKLANNSPVTHPQTVRQQEAVDRIKAATNGQVEIQLFPNNQLGSDTDMLSQLRSGAIDFFTLSGLILATLVPAASINGIGFAFKDYDTVWKAMDGKLGALCPVGDRQARPDRNGQDLGQRVPPDHQFHPSDQAAGGSEGLQDPRSGVAAVDQHVPGAGRFADQHQLLARSIRRCRPKSPRGRKTR